VRGKKATASNEIYSRELFNVAVGGNSAVICINLGKLALILIGDIAEYQDFSIIQNSHKRRI